MESRMNYPARSCAETDRKRRDRLALSRSVERQHEHAERFGPKPAKPTVNAYVRLKAGEVVTDLAAFQAMDYGQLCQALRLRPSKPNAPAKAA